MLSDHDAKELDRVGAIKLPQSLNGSELETLRQWTDGLDLEKPGHRIDDVAGLSWLLVDGNIPIIVRTLIGAGARPVRILLFNKTASTNWSLGWHQDRTIAVVEQRDAAGFGPWTTKAGIPHVEPPSEIIDRMVTLRVHLDDVDEVNAPLLIAPGSHRLGKIMEPDIHLTLEQCGSLACLARAGDAWLYRTPILHASKRSDGQRPRRVLHIDYSADELPGGLEWRMSC